MGTFILHGYEINYRVFFERWIRRSDHNKMDLNFVSPTYTAVELNETTVEYEDAEDPDGVFLLFILLVGDILVCIAIYTDRGLRRIGNLIYFSLRWQLLICWLLLLMTFAGVNDLLGYWVFDEQFCDTWVAYDVMCSTASILNLCAISLDRHIHTKDPLRYGRLVTRKVAIITIALIWLLAVLVSFLPISLGIGNIPTAYRLGNIPIRAQL